MSKPQGTYLRVQQQERTRFKADEARQTASSARSRDLEQFLLALDKVADRELDSWYRYLGALLDKLKKNEPISKEDKVREHLSDAIGKVREVVEQVHDIRQLEGRLNVPLQPVLRAPPKLGSLDLALVIALCQVFEVLVRLRRRK